MIKAIAGSRWFYLGLPLLAIVIGLYIGGDAYVAAAVNQHYHPVVPATEVVFLAELFLTLALAGAIAIILITFAKFALKSARRTSLMVAVFGVWTLFMVYLIANSQPPEPAYQRTYAGQRYAIEWGRLPGELTSRANPIRTWGDVSSIGFTYCYEPFDPTKGRATDCKRGTFLAGNRGLNSYDLSADFEDPEGGKLLDHLEKLETDPSYLSQLSSSSSPSRSRFISTSGGSAGELWTKVRAKRVPDIGGMFAFESEDPYAPSHFIYLFGKSLPESSRFHRAQCRKQISNGEVSDASVSCIHYLRDGENAWIFELPIADTANAASRLTQLLRQLESFRIGK